MVSGRFIDFSMVHYSLYVVFEEGATHILECICMIDCIGSAVIDIHIPLKIGVLQLVFERIHGLYLCVKLST